MLGIIEILEEENNQIENQTSKRRSNSTPKYVKEKFNKMFIQYGEAIKASNEKKLNNTNK
jgi:hypothetical protein